jgi:hypothetical protein
VYVDDTNVVATNRGQNRLVLGQAGTNIGVISGDGPVIRVNSDGVSLFANVESSVGIIGSSVVGTDIVHNLASRIASLSDGTVRCVRFTGSTNNKFDTSGYIIVTYNTTGGTGATYTAASNRYPAAPTGPVSGDTGTGGTATTMGRDSTATVAVKNSEVTLSRPLAMGGQNITTTGTVSANTLDATAGNITVSKPLAMGSNNITTTGTVSANTLDATAGNITVSKPLEMGANSITTTSADSSFAVKTKTIISHNAANVVILNTTPLNNGVYRCSAAYLNSNFASGTTTGISQFHIIKTNSVTNISSITLIGTSISYHSVSGTNVITTASVINGSTTFLFIEQFV